jgi:hypothetical protein
VVVPASVPPLPSPRTSPPSVAPRRLPRAYQRRAQGSAPPHGPAGKGPATRHAIRAPQSILRVLAPYATLSRHALLSSASLSFLRIFHSVARPPTLASSAGCIVVAHARLQGPFYR